jgi:D-methionine transport system permease protein
MWQQLWFNVDWQEIYQATLDTLLMLGISVLLSSIIGLVVGVTLYLTAKGHLLANRMIYSILGFSVNVLRSIPFIILLIVMMPATVMLVGTSFGVKGVIPPLVIGAFPFFARLVENALGEIDNGVIHMAESCGATTWQIIRHILLPEVLPNIIASITVTAIALVSYTAMAGTVGGGGLGDLAIRYGYQRFQMNVMVITVVLLVVLVQLIQLFGDKIMRVFKNAK